MKRKKRMQKWRDEELGRNPIRRSVELRRAGEAQIRKGREPGDYGRNGSGESGYRRGEMMNWGEIGHKGL